MNYKQLDPQNQKNIYSIWFLWKSKNYFHISGELGKIAWTTHHFHMVYKFHFAPVQSELLRFLYQVKEETIPKNERLKFSFSMNRMNISSNIDRAANMKKRDVSEFGIYLMKFESIFHETVFFFRATFLCSLLIFYFSILLLWYKTYPHQWKRDSV